MVDGLIEHLTHLIMILRLPEDPHELCHGGFQGHIVGLDETEGIFDLLANFVDGHVAAFLGDLGGHDDRLAHGDPFFNSSIEKWISMGKTVVMTMEIHFSMEL